MKNFSIIASLILLLTTCHQNESLELFEESPDWVLSIISPNSNPEVENLLQSVLGQNLINGRTITTYLGEVSLEEAIKSEDFRSGITR